MLFFLFDMCPQNFKFLSKNIFKNCAVLLFSIKGLPISTSDYSSLTKRISWLTQSKALHNSVVTPSLPFITLLTFDMIVYSTFCTFLYFEIHITVHLKISSGISTLQLLQEGTTTAVQTSGRLLLPTLPSSHRSERSNQPNLLKKVAMQLKGASLR